MPAEEATGLYDLPREIIVEIASELCTSDLNSFTRTNRGFNNLLFMELCRRHWRDPWRWDTAFFYYLTHGYEVGTRTMLAAGLGVHNRGSRPNSSPVLRHALQRGRLDLVKTLLDRGVCANHYDFDDSTPLCTVASGQCDVIPMMELLLEYKADVNLPGRLGTTPLISAICTRSIPIVIFLLSKGADVNACMAGSRMPLHTSVKYAPTELFKIILHAGAQVNCLDKQGMSPLHIAAYDLLDDRILDLLRYGADVNSRASNSSDNDWTALHYCAASALERNASKAIECLIKHGADVDAKDDKGRTPLLLVRPESDPTCIHYRVETLSRHGADIHARDNEGWSALHYQVDSMSVELFRWLCDRGCDINCKNNKKETPLSLAIMSKCGNSRKKAMIQTILSLGADPNLVDFQMNTPLCLSVTETCLDITRLLLEHGADVHQRDGNGRTPLHVAVTVQRLPLIWSGEDYLWPESSTPPMPDGIIQHSAPRQIHEIVQLLVQYGADRNAKDNLGYTPWQLNRQKRLSGLSGMGEDSLHRHSTEPFGTLSSEAFRKRVRNRGSLVLFPESLG